MPPFRRAMQRPGVLHRLLEGGPSSTKPDPVGVVENAGSFHRPAQPIMIGEVQGSRRHPPVEGAFPPKVSSQSPYADALAQQSLGDVSTSVAEGAGYDGLIGVGQSAATKWLVDSLAAAAGPTEACGRSLYALTSARGLTVQWRRVR